MDRWEKGVMYSGRLSTAGLWINIWRRHKILSSSSSDICEGTSRISIKTAYWVKDFASGSVPYPWYFRTDPNTDADPRIRTFNQRIRALLFSSATFKTSTKNIFFLRFYAYSFLNVNSHHSLKIS
jgi:hypothetical protein